MSTEIPREQVVRHLSRMDAVPRGRPVIIEAAINGSTPKSRNLHAPRTPVEIAETSVRCIELGAAIVHNHNDEGLAAPRGIHASQPYAEAWKVVRAIHPDAILYPTMAGGGHGIRIEDRYRHVAELAEAGILSMVPIDPGSLNFGGLDPDGIPMAVEVVYQNTYADARHLFDMANALGLPASISIFEPGFLRLALAYHSAGKMPPGSIIKLYFSGGTPGFGLSPSRAALEAYLEMLDGTGLPWLVAVLGGDVLSSGLAELALQHGGHLRVGLEDYAGPGTPSNEELMRGILDVIRKHGGAPASPAEARGMLGIG